MPTRIEQIRESLIQEGRLPVTATEERADEAPFRAYARRYGVEKPDNPRHRYDYRAAFRAGVTPRRWRDLPDEQKREDLRQIAAGTPAAVPAAAEKRPTPTPPRKPELELEAEHRTPTRIEQRREALIREGRLRPVPDEPREPELEPEAERQEPSRIEQIRARMAREGRLQPTVEPPTPARGPAPGAIAGAEAAEAEEDEGPELLRLDADLPTIQRDLGRVRKEQTRRAERYITKRGAPRPPKPPPVVLESVAVPTRRDLDQADDDELRVFASALKFREQRLEAKAKGPEAEAQFVRTASEGHRQAKGRGTIIRHLAEAQGKALQATTPRTAIGRPHVLGIMNLQEELQWKSARSVAQGEPALPIEPTVEQIVERLGVGKRTAEYYFNLLYRENPIAAEATLDPRVNTKERAIIRAILSRVPPPAEWKKRGKMGMAEAFKRGDPLALIPFVRFPAGAAQAKEIRLAAKRLEAGRYGAFPYKMGFMGIPTKMRVSPQAMQLIDRARIEQFILEQAEAVERGQTIPAQVTGALEAMAPWLAEFYFTSPIARTVAAPVKKAVISLLGRFATTPLKAAGLRAGVWGAGLLARGAVRAPFFMPTEMEESQIPRRMALTPEGGIRILERGDSPAKAFFRAYESAFISAFSEETGEMATGALGAVLSRVPGVRRAFAPLARKLGVLARKAPGGIQGVFTRAGYSNWIGEMSEESLERILRAVLNVPAPGQSLEARQTFYRRLADAIYPGMETLLVEAITLAVPGAAKVGAGAVARAYAPDVLVQAEQVAQRATAAGKTSQETIRMSAAVIQRAARDKGVAVTPEQVEAMAGRIIAAQQRKERAGEIEPTEVPAAPPVGVEERPAVEPKVPRAEHLYIAGRDIETLDATKAKDAEAILKVYSDYLTATIPPPLDAVSARAIDQAFETLHEELETGQEGVRVWALPGKAKALAALLAKMRRIKPAKARKPGVRVTKPRILPARLKTREKRVKAIMQASAREDTRYALAGAFVEGENLVVTDGRRLWLAKGDWGPDGLYEVAKDGSFVGKKEGNFPEYQKVIPEEASDPTKAKATVEIEPTLRNIRLAALMTSEEAVAVHVLLNPDGTLGFAAHGFFDDPRGAEGSAEINVQDGYKSLGKVNPKSLREQLVWHYANGDNSVTLWWADSTKAITTKGDTGKTTGVCMPMSPLSAEVTPEEAARKITEARPAEAPAPEAEPAAPEKQPWEISESQWRQLPLLHGEGPAWAAFHRAIMSKATFREAQDSARRAVLAETAPTAPEAPEATEATAISQLRDMGWEPTRETDGTWTLRGKDAATGVAVEIGTLESLDEAITRAQESPPVIRAAPKAAEAPVSEPGAPEMLRTRVGEEWDASKLGYKVELVRRGRWITKDGRLTRLGEKIAESRWADLSPAVKKIIGREIGKDYPRLAQEPAPPSAPVRPKRAPKAPVLEEPWATNLKRLVVLHQEALSLSEPLRKANVKITRLREKSIAKLSISANRARLTRLSNLEREAEPLERRLTEIRNEVPGIVPDLIPPGASAEHIAALEYFRPGIKPEVPAPKVEKPPAEQYEIVNNRLQRAWKRTFPTKEAAQQFLEKKVTAPAGQTQFFVRPVSAVEAKPEALESLMPEPEVPGVPADALRVGTQLADRLAPTRATASKATQAIMRAMARTARAAGEKFDPKAFRQAAEGLVAERFPTEPMDVEIESAKPGPRPVVETFRAWPKGVRKVNQDYWTEVMAAARDMLTPFRYNALRQTTLGTFKLERGVLLQDIRDTLTATHEVGHAMDWLMNDKSFPGSITKRFLGAEGEMALRKELAEVSKVIRPALWADKVSAYIRTYVRNHRELMADFFSLYVLDPNMARAKAPTVTDLMDKKLAAYPKLRETVAMLRANRYTGAALPAIAERIREEFPLPEELQPLQLLAAVESEDYATQVTELGLASERHHKVLLEKARVQSDRIRTLVPDQEIREDLRVLVENGTKNLRTGKTREQIQKELTPAGEKALKLYRGYQELARQTVNKYLRGGGIVEYISFIEDYFVHAYEKDLTQKQKNFVARWVKRSPQARKRIFPTLEEALEAGFMPRTQDIADGLLFWSRVNSRVATNLALLRILPTIVNAEGDSILQKPSDKPEWPTVDYWPIRRTYARALPGRGVLLWEGQVAVDPRVKPFITALFDKPFTNRWVQALAGVNAIAKGLELTMPFMNFFHHIEETYSAIGGLGPRITGLWGKEAEAFGAKPHLRGFLPARIGPLKAGKMLRETPELVEDYLKHGGQLGRITSQGINRLERMMRWVEDDLKDITGDPNALATVSGYPEAVWRVPPKVTPTLRLARLEAAGMRRLYTFWQSVLWDNVERMKLLTYYETVRESMARCVSREAADKPVPSVKRVKEMAARYVNNNFGGQEWLNTMTKHPKARQVIFQLFLSWDWTYGQLKTPLFLVGRGLGARTAAERVLLRRIGYKHWMWYLLACGLGTIAGNLIGSPGRFPWENEKGHKIDVDFTWVWRKQDEWLSKVLGRANWRVRGDYARRYFGIGKAAREFIRWLHSWRREFGNKLSPLARTAFEQLVGYNLGSDFPQPWMREDMELYDNLYARLGSVAEKFLPFALTGNSAFLAFPTGKGMTQWKAIRAFEDLIKADAALAEGGVRGALYKTTHLPADVVNKLLHKNRTRLIREIEDACWANRVDVEKSFRAAMSGVKRSHWRKFWTGCRNLNAEEANRQARVLKELGVTLRAAEMSLRARRETISPEAERMAARALLKAGLPTK